MKIYAAPLEGLTDGVWRHVHQEMFGQVDKYFIPFITPNQNMMLPPREQRAVRRDETVYAVPQLLGKEPEPFLHTCRMLAMMGYEELNLNLGCPSGTVTAKVKGSGMLREKEQLDRFLDAVCGKCALPLSLKIRIGYEKASEFPALWEIFARYPMPEMIIHPRTKKEGYTGPVHDECWRYAAENAFCPLVMNGNIVSPADAARYPETDTFMLGRGLMADPALPRVMKGGAPLSREEMAEWIARLEQGYAQEHQPLAVFIRMRDHLKYLAFHFTDAKKAEKAIRKARTMEDLHEAVRRLLDCPMTEQLPQVAKT
ncbi:MAG: tRNA-dihydrouridine synthase family protein [Clostridia bacterium]|nr:tRNA-dihydrouridine synthase family protein [Clostridia bacterium]